MTLRQGQGIFLGGKPSKTALLKMSHKKAQKKQKGIRILGESGTETARGITNGWPPKNARIAKIWDPNCRDLSGLTVANPTRVNSKDARQHQPLFGVHPLGCPSLGIGHSVSDTDNADELTTDGHGSRSERDGFGQKDGGRKMEGGFF
jgi:hypothetical protein